MNNLLQLKGQFHQRSNNSTPGPATLPGSSIVLVEHLETLLSQLKKLYGFWSTQTVVKGALISVYYIDVIAKSNRISAILHESGKVTNNTIVGAKFTDKKNPKHIITHYIHLDSLNTSISKLDLVIKCVKEKMSGVVSQKKLDNIDALSKYLTSIGLSKSAFNQIIVDAYYAEKFDLPDNSDIISDNALVTLYKTDDNIKEIMDKLGIDILTQRIIEEDSTVLLTPDQLELLKMKAPYLIAMTLSDISELSKDDFITLDDDTLLKLPNPTNEPTIGVIDTLFDTRCYFSNWVEYHKMITDDIETSSQDMDHGTAVSSIIVDGPNINPELDDGCGRFKVRHFGVALSKQMSSFAILRHIKEIVKTNKDIRVWNLSLGSALEINPNFISPEAAILDKIQYENNVIFVIAGTNKQKESVEMIGAPADSINALVVNSVDSKGKSASYSRKGLVLSFFNKPDICYYGGDKNDYIKACNSCGECLLAGTSFAAPWISRKMSYLIDILGLSREVAKALIIDSATNWKKTINQKQAPLLGYGVVPKRIEDIINSKDDEIKFVIEGISEKYDTYTYDIPVPLHNDKYPFISKATLCYFPNCSRNQGVDYTNTELDLSFGRIDDRGHIKTINNNYQTEEGHYMYEGNARKNYRKWDNVKHIIEILKDGSRPKKKYSNELWGISIKTKERLEKRDGEGIKFGIVITLKEINGINRIDDFVRMCSLRKWLVTKVDVENKIELYNKAEEEIDLK